MIERLVSLYRSSSDERSVAALLIANMIPLVGVVFFGWDLATILVIYWLENGIVGLWNVPRMILAGREADPMAPSVPSASPGSSGSPGSPGSWIRPTGLSVILVPFFLLHYGIFWLVHGVFVFVLTSGFGGPGGFFLFGGFSDGDGGATQSGPVWSQVWLAALALFISHGLSFYFNYIRGGEYKRTSVFVQMFQPYARVVVMHVTIIFGAFLTFILGSPIGLLIVLVVLKTALDLGLHGWRHRTAVVAGAPATFG